MIVDGLGDLPVAGLGGRTPLEAADTPNLDAMAASGFYGLLDPLKPGVKPNTHSGAGMLLGMQPGQTSNLPRGVVEAAGAGLILQPGDIALRCNFATVASRGSGLVVTDRRAGRIDENTKELAAQFSPVNLGDGVSAVLNSTDQHRAVLVLSGEGLGVPVSDTDPGDIGMPAAIPRCVAGNGSAGKTARKINEFVQLAHERLAIHPVNQERVRRGRLPASGVITRGAGAVAVFENEITRLGIPAAVVAGCNTVKGLGRLFGFQVFDDRRFTATLETDLEAKIAAVISALKHKELVYLHVKAPDLCAHDRQPEQKKVFIERLDRALAPLMDAETMVAVTADHTTDSNSGFHTADPVPALLWIPDRISKLDVQFSERSCADGNMSRRVSNEFLKMITDMITA
jgi:2,3-bisphosphoglycerate-independent phosphoglycerate mutase